MTDAADAAFVVTVPAASARVLTDCLLRDAAILERRGDAHTAHVVTSHADRIMHEWIRHMEREAQERRRQQQP